MADETDKKKEYVPVYYETPERAYRESVSGPEAEAFKASFAETGKCAGDIQAALEANRKSSGKFSSTAFIDGLLDKYGRERVEYVLASYIRSREDEMPYFTDEVKAWAHGIRISDSRLVSGTILIGGGDDMVNALASELRLRDAAAARAAVKEGDDAADGEKAEDDEIAGDASIFSDDDAVAKNEDGTISVTMPGDAVIRRYQTSAVLCMPRGRGYDMFRYMVDTKNLRDTGEGMVTVTLGTNDEHALTIRRRGQEVKLSADKVYEVFSGAGVADYIPKKHTLEFPADAVQGNYPNMIRCRFPDSSVYAGQHVVIPTIYKDEILSNDEKTVFSVPDYMNFSVRNPEGDDILVPVTTIEREVNGGTYKKKIRWTHVDLPAEALLHVYDRHVLLKMPKGTYSGYVYYLPNGMAPVGKDGTIRTRVPEERRIEIKNGATGQKESLTVLQWSNLVSGKGSDAYAVTRRDATDADEKEFSERAERIRAAVPTEMLEESSWIPVAARGTREGTRVQKFALSPDASHGGGEAMYQNIGTDFDSAVKAGLSSGATHMGFCFSKESDVACVELDGCLDADGKPLTRRAEIVLESPAGLYVEKSVSGRGLHVFGKLPGSLSGRISSDGEAEVFSQSGYIMLTGDAVSGVHELHPIEDTAAGKALGADLAGAEEISEPTKEDRKILVKAMEGQNGQDFEVLYRGGEVRGGKEFGDMSLAMRLCNAAGGDEKAVMRLYNASGREKLDPETAAHLAKRAANAAKGRAREKIVPESHGKYRAAESASPDDCLGK